MHSEPTTQRIPKLVQELLDRSRARAAAAAAASGEIREAEARLRQEAEARRNTGIVEHLLACGMPSGAIQFPFEDGLKPTAALKGVLEWLNSPKPFCILSGPPGAGKSVAAAYSLLWARRKVRTMAHPLADAPIEIEELDHRFGLYVTAAALRFASRWEDGPQLSLVDRAATVPWLVLDELRAAELRDKGLERIQEVLGERYARSRRTVITTNLTQGELARLIGDALASRFAEGAVVVDPGDVDLRRAGT